MIWAPLTLIFGLAAGLVAGFFGIGGGIVFVPTYLEILSTFPGVHAPMQMAVATSQATIFCTMLLAVRKHRKYGGIQYKTAMRVGVGGIFGAIIGGYSNTVIDGNSLRFLFVGLIILVALKTFLYRHVEIERSNPHTPLKQSLAGVFIGAFAGFFGAGGGVLGVPYLLRYCNLKVHDAMATSSAIILITSSVATTTCALSGLSDPQDVPFSLGYLHYGIGALGFAGSLIGVQLGVSWARKVSRDKLIIALSVLLVVVALRVALR